MNVDGLRGDIVVNRAAKALVAFEGRTEVKEADIERVISLCLNHRYQQGGGARWQGAGGEEGDWLSLRRGRLGDVWTRPSLCPCPRRFFCC